MRVAIVSVCVSWCAIVCATASIAAAEPARFEVLDRGNAVEIIARNVRAASTAITPVRSRLEVPVVGGGASPKLVPAGDKTIKVVELDGGSQRVLSVKLAFERPEVQTLAKHAQAIQVGNDLHLLVPRIVPVAGQTFSLPEPTLPPALAEKAAAIAPVPTIATPATAPTAPAAIQPSAEKPADAQPDKSAAPLAGIAKPAAQPASAAPAKAAPIAKATSPRDNVPILIALTLAALGGAVWLKRRNQKPNDAMSSIEVIAQKSLGAKAKIVWLRCGEREMIVSVTAQAVRMLGQWRRGEAPEPKLRAPLPEAVTHHVAPESSSPAVAGILRLRAKTNAPINEDVLADGTDPDAAWAREILAATTGARR